jgi:drug/metabolite transporter (DMT)-like permease
MVELINGLGPNQRIFIVLFFALMISMSEGIAQYLVKRAQMTSKISMVLLGIFFYGLVCFMLYRSYSFENVGHMNLVWSCMSIIIAFISGFFIFEEPFNWYTVLAIIFACIAIYFSHRADEV